MNPAAAPVASVAPTASLHRFDAYRLALAFRGHVVRWLPLKRAELSDQLDRASISCCLNLAEGAGRSGRDQARHYAIARGSAFECLAVLDLLDLETAPAGQPSGPRRSTSPDGRPHRPDSTMTIELTAKAAFSPIARNTAAKPRSPA